ncbi:17385_t:CDS:2 [Funneliformis geosporum]|uniref:17385_t:CDS:1 n=1 Tax=Funneliformis geosporum TaxID=1117311 RepID=A0A9W4WSR7_9GLOM|nr:17385_t:CDS:2 [Funneliformis geosporum]
MANTLYDSTVPLFYHVFEDTDKFLPSVLCGNQRWMTALGRIGLKRQVNCNTFIECVQEIRSQIEQPTRFPASVVKTRAKFVLEYLYAHTLTLYFTNDQWDQILQIEFIPSEYLQNSRFYENAIETSGFERTMTQLGLFLVSK